MAVFTLAVTEGLLEQTVNQKVMTVLAMPQPARFITKGGKDAFWRDAARYNIAAIHAGPILGLADLEGEACAVELIRRHLPAGIQPSFALRIAERMLEAWILADRIALARFLAVGVSRIPRDPEREGNPKLALVNAARHSTRREIREDMVPPPGSTGVVGRGYIYRTGEFIRRDWRPLIAQNSSQSLKRAIAAIRAHA